MRLAGRCALVTGAASGLGKATAEALHAGGASVLLIDTSREQLEPVAARLGSRAWACKADVRNVEEITAAIALAVARLGTMHIAVNCAGVASAAKTVTDGQPHDLELWRRVVDINLTGTFNVMRLAAVQMAQNAPDEETGERGVIVNTASIAAYDGQRGQVAYAASKAGVVGMTLPAARDLAAHAVRCVAIAPGLMQTRILDDIPPQGVAALKRSLLYPNRMGDAAEFAALVRHVIDNPYINGTCLRLDGGARLTA